MDRVDESGEVIGLSISMRLAVDFWYLILFDVQVTVQRDKFLQ